MQAQNKNTLIMQLQLTGTYIVLCYGKKAYKKYCKKRFNLFSDFQHLGVSTEFLNTNTISYEIVIGIGKSNDVYNVKSTTVHELSHAVSQWMEYFGFNCDEVRSYTLQMIYKDTMIFLDRILLEQQIKKEDKENKAQEDR